MINEILNNIIDKILEEEYLIWDDNDEYELGYNAGLKDAINEIKYYIGERNDSNKKDEIKLDINIINIEFKTEYLKHSTTLHNWFDGHDIYKFYIEDYIDFNCKNIIIFPNNIIDVSISFIKGFVEKLFIHSIKPSEFDKYIEIQANPTVVEKFKKGIWF